MAVRSLAYIRVEASNLGAWRAFGEGVCGLKAVEADDAGDALHLRMDGHPWRFRIERGTQDRIVATGLELTSERDFEDAVARIERQGITVERLSDADAKLRNVKAAAGCADPSGNRIELVWGTTIAGTPFVSPQGNRFVTGDGGMGHVVFPAGPIGETRAFYVDLLGFGDSDEMRLHFPGTPEEGLGLHFLHAAGNRHHTVAIGQFPAPSGMIHAMVEVETLDEVGLALDRALAAGCHISATLGKHTNDGMVSFYVRTPGGFDLEYGCGGFTCDDWSRFTPTFTLKEDLWGHKWDFGT